MATANPPASSDGDTILLPLDKRCMLLLSLSLALLRLNDD